MIVTAPPPAPTVGSLYSGVGGSDLGFERAGLRVAWQVECDPWRARVLARHWPTVSRHRRVELVAAEDLEPVDLLAVTPPSADPSWLVPVWPVVARLRPTFVLLASGSRCVEALEAGFEQHGYAGGVLNLSCRLHRGLGGALTQRQAFAVGYDPGAPVPEAVLGRRDFEASDLGGGDPASIIDVFEMLTGLPARWSCVCGREAVACTESAERLLAANDCLSPSLCAWLGQRLRALMPVAA